MGISAHKSAELRSPSPQPMEKVMREMTLPGDGIKPSTSLGGSWVYGNMMFDEGVGCTLFGPALTEYGGELWCLWDDRSTGNLYYGRGTNAKDWQRYKFADPNPKVTDRSAIASIDNTVHAVIIQDFSMTHYRFDQSSGWFNPKPVTNTAFQPSLCNFNGQLFCAFLQTASSLSLSFCKWDPYTDQWSSPKSIGITAFAVSALYVVDDKELHLLYVAKAGGGPTTDLVYNVQQDSFSAASSSPNEQSKWGCCATSFGDTSWMGFLKNDSSNQVLVSECDNHNWQNNSATGHYSATAPALAVLDGVLNCVFSSNNSPRDLLLLQRPCTPYALDSWMSHLDNGKPISALSIPGTHDSCARGSYSGTYNFVVTQDMTITEQLNAGIRYFDLRVVLYNGQLSMFHGEYYLNISFELVVQQFHDWLQKHQSEAIIAQIAEETSDQYPTNPDFVKVLISTLQSSASLWRLDTDSPTLGQLRGKIQLMRRFGEDSDTFGIDVRAWLDNRKGIFTITTNLNVTLQVQDYYSIDASTPGSQQNVVDVKVGLVTSTFTSALAAPLDQWFLNWTSGYSRQPLNLMNPWMLATDRKTWTGVNTKVRQWLAEGPLTGRVGVVLFNFPESPQEDLTAAIIQLNG